jgi:nucleotide-binding universal stress UspA family protein
VAIASAGIADAARRRRVAEEAAIVRSATGLEPVVVDEPRAAPEAIVAAAAAAEASLIVIGSRGRAGLAALGSVSERVAHHAGCSVLVVRPSASRGDPGV